MASGPTLVIGSSQEQSKTVGEMVREGIASVPSHYVRPARERPLIDDLDCVSNVGTINKGVQLSQDETLAIPAIDFRGIHPDAIMDDSETWQDLVRQVGQACLDWGFFKVVNPGIDLTSVLKAVNRFNDLPSSEKLKIPFGSADSAVTVATGTGATRDWKDALVIRRRPGVCNGFQEGAPEILRQEMLDYQVNLDKLALVIRQAIFQSLGFSQEYIESCVPGLVERLVLVVNFYPPCPEPSLVFGQSAHSDLNGITLLLQDDVPGLQVRKEDKWILVQPTPNSIIVNVGDQIEILTNGKYKSVEHRVVVQKDRARISLAALFGPYEDAKIGPLKALVDENNPPIYKELEYGEYIRNYYVKKLPLHKTTLNIAGGTYKAPV